MLKVNLERSIKMTRQQRDLQIQERKLWEMYNTIIELYGKDSAQAKGTKEAWEYISYTLKELGIPDDRKEKSILAIAINKAKRIVADMYYYVCDMVEGIISVLGRGNK
jgi:hypothetical protein